MNTKELDRQLDKTKASVFMGTDAAFLGCIMCSITFSWDESIPTACTDGVSLSWNPTWFMTLPEKTRNTVLVHELWHVARLHPLRGGNRNHQIWCIACDAVVNNALKADGYSFDGITPILMPEYNGMSEEQIYELLMANNPNNQQSSWSGDQTGDSDLKPADGIVAQQVTNTVVRAVQAAKMMDKAGNAVGQVEELVSNFLKPIIPWQAMLYNYFESMLSDEYSWSRPNRRYSDMYLPSKIEEENKLKDLHYYFDTSGSVSSDEIRRFNSEVAYIKETFNPEKLTIIQFDVAIRKTIVVTQADQFNSLNVTGRGGTSLKCVHDHIIETKPTVSIIFSDLRCTPMQELSKEFPVIWVVVDNPNRNPTFGKVIHIER